MHALIRLLYKMFFTLSLGFLLFISAIIISQVFQIIKLYNGVYFKVPVKIETYENLPGDASELSVSVGFHESKRIQIFESLQIDSVYLVWNCDKEYYSSLVKSEFETIKQFKTRKTLSRIKTWPILISIEILLFILSIFFGRLMKKYNISDDVD